MSASKRIFVFLWYALIMSKRDCFSLFVLLAFFIMSETYETRNHNSWERLKKLKFGLVQNIKNPNFFGIKHKQSSPSLFHKKFLHLVLRDEEAFKTFCFSCFLGRMQKRKLCTHFFSDTEFLFLVLEKFPLFFFFDLKRHINDTQKKKTAILKWMFSYIQDTRKKQNHPGRFPFWTQNISKKKSRNRFLGFLLNHLAG